MAHTPVVVTPGKPITAANTTESRRWWKLSAKDACASITACLGQLEDQEKMRGASLIRHMRLYSNSPVNGYNGTSMQQAAIDSGPYKDRISLNVCQAATDTITSKIAKNKPKPYYVTSAGDHDQQRKAKNRNKLIDGVFYENNAYRLGMFAFRDGVMVGDGIIHVYSRDGRVKYERVLAGELKIDEIEGQHGNPRQLHWTRPIDRFVLADAFPGKRAKIMAAVSSILKDGASLRPNIADMLMVRESWHLPSGPDATDGKHIITLEDEPLTEMQPWRHEFFPFAFYSWSKRPIGFWSQGGIEQISPIQLEVNKILLLVQKSYHLGGSFKVLMEMGSQIVPEHINNLIGTVIKYKGTEPKYIVPPLLPPEMYQQLNWLYGKAFTQFGISETSTAGVIPQGMERASGKALRTMGDIQTDRFQTNGREYENLFMDLAKITFAVLKDMFEDGEIKRYDVKVPHQRWIERIDVRDVDLEDDDNCVLQCFPVSALSQEPAQRLVDVQELMQAGLVSPRQGKRLLNFPDLEQEESLTSASDDWLEKVLGDIVDGETDDEGYQTPEPYDDPERGFELAQQYYLIGKRDNLPEERLELLRRFMRDCLLLIKKAQPPAPMLPPGAPANGPAPANPEPTPESPMLPNVNQPGAAA